MLEKAKVTDVLTRAKEILGEIDDNIGLLQLFNIVESEVVSNVIKLTDLIKVKLTKNSGIPISKFPKKLVKIKDIYYEEARVFWEYPLGNPDSGIHVPGYGDKEVVVEYYYIPNYKEGNSKSDLPVNLIDILVYGVVAEYFLVTGDYVKAKKYSRKYSKAIYYGNRKKLLRDLGEILNG